MTEGIRFSILLVLILGCGEVIAATVFKDGIISQNNATSGSVRSEFISPNLENVVPLEPQIIDSAARCEDLLETETPWKVMRNGTWVPEYSYAGVREHCVVIGKLTGKHSFSERHIWHAPFNIWTRPKADGTIDVISLAHDKPFLQNEITFQPGKSYLFRVSLDINELFQSSLNSAELISHWPVPFSYRRAQLADVDADGDDELVILGSREDGRGPADGPSTNMFDQNYIVDFEAAKITAFGVPQFSHEMVVSNLDSDSYPEVLDMGYTNFRGKRGTWICDGKSLECKWNQQTNFGANNADLKKERSTGRNILVANCGHRYVKHNEGDSLCWFEANYNDKNQRLYVKLISKHVMRFNASAKLKNFMGVVASVRGWKIEGKKPNQEFLMGKQGYHTSLIDLDNDGDLDTVNYVANMRCVKKDASKGYFDYSDCENHTVMNEIFLQTDGKFVRQDSKSIQMIVPAYGRYSVFDINNDGLDDVYNYGQLRRGVSKAEDCYDPLRLSLINQGNGKFATIDRDEVVGQYGCEIANQFFTFKGKPFRLFFAHKDATSVGDEAETYLALEYLGENIEAIIEYSDESVCKRAVGFKFVDGVSTRIFSTFASAEKWVSLARSRGLSCGVV